jgi:hypothetical protein
MAGLDDISEMADSGQIGRYALEQREDNVDVESVARRLIASSFYYETEELLSPRLDGSHFWPHVGGASRKTRLSIVRRKGL